MKQLQAIRIPMTQFTEGVNTYRIVPIIMQDDNADELIAELQRKKKENEPITKKELVHLTLCPLMSGQMEQIERLKASYKIAQGAEILSEEEFQVIEAVLYAMAEKFLETTDMGKFAEEIRMTKLGRILLETGAKETKLENAKNLIDILDERVIAERIGLPLETVQKLKEESLNKK